MKKNYISGNHNFYLSFKYFFVIDKLNRFPLLCHVWLVSFSCQAVCSRNLLHLCSCSGEAHYLMMLSVLFRGHVAHLDDDDGDDDDSKQ